MLRRSLALPAIVACLASAGGAAAQDTPEEAYFRIWSADRAQVNLRKQATCLARKYPAEARHVVIDDLPMRTIFAELPGFIKPCGEGALFKDNHFSISQPVLEFVLAEALLANIPEAPSPAALAAAPPLSRESLPKDLTGISPKMRERFAISATILRLDAAAECAVRRASGEAWTLATSRPASGPEAASLERLGVAVRACDPSVTSTPPFILRGIVAYNLYRLLDAVHLVGGGKESPHA